MSKALDPYDLGKINITDYCQKVNINELVKKLGVELKKRILESEIEALGIEVKLTTSNTRFEGKRLWFLCPICERRVGAIYKHPALKIVGCRTCLNLKYKKQRLKGMVEEV